MLQAYSEVHHSRIPPRDCIKDLPYLTSKHSHVDVENRGLHISFISGEEISWKVSFVCIGKCLSWKHHNRNSISAA